MRGKTNNSIETKRENRIGNENTAEHDSSKYKKNNINFETKL